MKKNYAGAGDWTRDACVEEERNNLRLHFFAYSSAIWYCKLWLCQFFVGILLRCFWFFSVSWSFMKKSLVKGIWNANEKARKMKKVFCFDICSCHYLRQNLSTSDLSFSQVTSVEKREPRKHFSASAYGLGFKNFFLGTLFSTSVTWEKLKSDVDKLCLRRVKNKYRNKILLFVSQNISLHWEIILKESFI